jgi:hypothetical protein
MVCKATATSVSNRPWNNWIGDQFYLVEQYWQPTSLEELVFVVEKATNEGKKLKAVGSGWSYGDVAVSADWVVSLAGLTRRLTHIIGDDAATHLAHFEAGIQIHNLNADLVALTPPVALPTMGSSGGQTLAGAIATSTHGCDLEYGPFPDLVRAVHLVAEGGREHWIESASRPITDDAKLKPQLCPDAQIIRDDQIFDAVRVSVGRFGVIYSFVIEVEPAFRLAERTIKRPRAFVLDTLRAGVAPLLAQLPGPGDLSGEAKARALQVVFDVYNADECYITRRWRTTRADLKPEKPMNPVCVWPVPQLLLQAVGLVIAHWAPIVALIPGYGPIRAANMSKWIADLNARSLDATLKGYEAMSLVLRAAWDCELGFLVPQITKWGFDGEFGPSMDPGRCARSDLIMVGKRPSRLEFECIRAESTEIMFPADSPAYVDFVEHLLALAPTLRIAGFVSLRFSKASDALLSMHNVPSKQAVSIEVASMKGLDDNALWMSTVVAIAVGMGGRPHWGQRNNLQAKEVRKLYGARLDAWQIALSYFATREGVFSNAYTVQRDLEPKGDHEMPKLTMTASASEAKGTWTYKDERWECAIIGVALSDAGVAQARIVTISAPEGASPRLAPGNAVVAVGDRFLRLHVTDADSKMLIMGSYMLGIDVSIGVLRATATVAFEVGHLSLEAVCEGEIRKDAADGNEFVLVSVLVRDQQGEATARLSVNFPNAVWASDVLLSPGPGFGSGAPDLNKVEIVYPWGLLAIKMSNGGVIPEGEYALSIGVSFGGSTGYGLVSFVAKRPA